MGVCVRERERESVCVCVCVYVGGERGAALESPCPCVSPVGPDDIVLSLSTFCNRT